MNRGALMIVDIRSDTVTQPCDKMREAMARAEVGDDVFGEDPTVNRLQERISGILGKEAGLFVASGTMANQVAINTHTCPGQEIIVDSNAHIFIYECGAPSVLSGVQLYPILGQRGVITTEMIMTAIRPPNVHYPRTGLICLENTHNRGGGTIYPIEEIKQIRKVADEFGIPMHMDGARLWNASVASGISMKTYASYFDSVSVCFSKGLGAPVGSMLTGNESFIQRARRYRKMYGGGMRQAGIIAAAALYAVENNVKRLKEDHLHARMLAEKINALPGLYVDLEAVQTNIVYVELKDTKFSGSQAVEELHKHGVMVLATDLERLRLVTHLDVIREKMEFAVHAFEKVFHNL
jgi:threonine aldolase